MKMQATVQLRRRPGRYALHASITAMALVALAPATAIAQTSDPAPAEQEDDAQSRDDIVVTGTRVIRDGFQAPTPLTVLTQQDIQNQSPTNNIADFVNQIPSVAGSLRPANSRLAISSGLAGINALNLRALGEIRTLVLLDGRRSPGSSVTGLVDINTFPQALVQSVEIVTGGASAAYGSDAVAGVVNFVLDKKYEGLKVAIDSGITGEGDGFNYSFSVAGGLKFAGGRGHVLVSAELAKRDGIFQVDRDWNQFGFRTIPNPAFTNTNGLPQNLVVSGAGTANALPGGIINNSAGGVANRLRGIYFGQGGSVNQFQYGALNSPALGSAGAPTLTQGGDWQLADNSRNIGLDAADDRRGIFGRVSYEVAPWAEVYAEAAYNWQESDFNAGPQLSTAVTLRSDNAFLINTLGPARLAGITSVTIGTTAVDLPVRRNNNQRDVQRYTIGGGGDFEMFGKRAVWSAYAQYGETNTREQLRSIMNTNRIALATDAVFAPAGNAAGIAAGTIVCRSTLTAPTNGCVPLNRLGINVTSQAAIDYVLGDPYREQKLQQTVAGVNLSFTPFATWAGDVSIAVGGEYRREEVSGFVPTEFQTGWSVGNFLPTFGDYDVKEAYFETVVPLGGGVEFNGAVRATDYSTSGYVTTWKVGTTWQPIEDLRFRVTRSRDIRAPNLNELFQAGTSRTNTLTDPFPEPDRVGVTFRETTTGNLNLDPEIADTTSVGVIFTPRFLPGFSASIDAYLIELEGAIGQFFAQDIINRCFEGRQEFCAAFGPDPTGDRELFFRASPFNFASITNRGIDIDASYRIPLDTFFANSEGTFTLRGLATRYIDNITDSGVSIPVDTVGANGGGGLPEWIFRFNAVLDTPSYTITGTARGVSSGTISNNFIECQTTCPTGRPAAIVSQFPTIDDNSVSGLFYVDLNLTAKLNINNQGDGQVFLNITNLFDRAPLLLPEGGLSANTTYSDLLGRAFRVGIRLQTK
ncbi:MULTISPECIES: TonB-dependent receptor plug domain-containing protein [unclassified Sphingomonas]|jgi:outer membrane receptor protein involved in Fe transport|uniref:TonB-dependent receptor plug domain-containing protein n=2 Tax=unclassified Sphingomonas TaxID=196159 RepID=UPI000A8FDA59|nr:MULTISPECIES: TonB-dependent receptor [unclassified Sphingomonas]